MTKHQIITAALALEPHERDEVAEALLQSNVASEFTRDQLAEIKRRIASIDSGESQTLPGDQVMEELLNRYRR